MLSARIVLRQLDYDVDDKTAFHGAASDALTRAIAIAKAEPRRSPPHEIDREGQRHPDH
jgi:hypothetical protein